MRLDAQLRSTLRIEGRTAGDPDGVVPEVGPLPDRRAVGLWVVFGVVFTLNLLAAVPPAALDVVPIGGVVGTIGSVAMTAIAVILLIEMRRPSPAAATPRVSLPVAAPTQSPP